MRGNNMPNHLFRLNREKWDALIKLRGWKHPISRLACLTGFTKSYLSQVINGGIPVSHDFMLAIIEVSGNSLHEPDEWGSLFNIEKIPQEKRYPIQKDNYKKYDGKLPYVKNSLSGKMRREDKARDLIRLKLPKPIPAQYFYDDKELIPQKCYYAAKYKR